MVLLIPAVLAVDIGGMAVASGIVGCCGGWERVDMGNDEGAEF